MRQTEFEGVPATIPYSFDRILVDEYGSKSLVTTEWEGHQWKPELKEWVKKPKPEGQQIVGQATQHAQQGSKTGGH